MTTEPGTTNSDTRPDPQLIVVAVSRDDLRRLEGGELVVKPDDTPGPVRVVQLHGSTTRVALTCTPYAGKLRDQLEEAGLTRAPQTRALPGEAELETDDRTEPGREQIALALREHHPRTSMVVSSGVTCECGYWNGVERPGVDRPAGSQGRDGLDWHRAQVVLALLAGEQA